MTYRFVARDRLLFWCLIVGLLATSEARAQRGFELPDTVTRRAVDIWSEGTRLAGDLYAPRDLAADETRPTIVMSHGWGGTKALLANVASRLAAEDYLVLAFDYRGWGESDGKLVVQGDMPDRDADGIVTVRAREIRNVVDPIDQTVDIQRAFDFIEGEPNVDTTRLGYWGSSYSGAHAIWVAAHEPRAGCAVGQVAAADSRSLAAVSWAGQDIAAHARLQAIRRARGDIDPLPQGTDKAPNLNGWAHLDKVLSYNPVDDAGRITIPLLVIDAENEELFDRHIAGELAIQRAQANGAPAEYTVIPDITHYQVYGDHFEEATQMAVDWFAGCWK
ncbi:MAG: CocE/NonD family hydrolase [Acidobacteriota bacterium]|nr:CocE/NonD family hydrolase [Acidobacteriota bacterium]